MAGKIKHRYVNPVADAGSPSETGPNEWNDSLVLSEGANGDVATRDSGQADGWKWASAVPRSFLSGYRLSNNVGDAANDIDISVGMARSDDDTDGIVLASALIKRLDAAFAAGTNQGMLDTGAKAANTWYTLFGIKDVGSGAVDVLASVSATAPTMPSGFTKKRRVGAILTDGSGNIRAFTQVGDWFLWTTPLLDLSADLTEAATLRTLSVPDGVRVLVLLNVAVDWTASGQALYLSSPDQTDQAPSLTASPLSTLANIKTVYGQVLVHTNTARQIRSRAVGTFDTAGLSLATLAWADRRGKDD